MYFVRISLHLDMCLRVSGECIYTLICDTFAFLCSVQADLVRPASLADAVKNHLANGGG